MSAMDQLKKYLQDIDLCNVCFLRFTCNRGVAQILRLIKEQECEPSIKKVAKNPCCTCLGLLSQGSLEKIIADILHQNSNFQQFQVNLSIPVSIPLRNHILECLIRTKFTDKDIDVDPVPVQAVWKKLFVMKLREKLPSAKLCDKSVFQIHIKTSHEDANAECAQLFSKCDRSILFPAQCRMSNTGSDGSNTKGHFNHSAIQRAIQSLSTSEFAGLKLESPNSYFSLDSLNFSNEPLYLAGRYNKFSRKISQTPWVIEGERKITESVQEMITDSVSKFIKADSMKFSASGREDVDVQMLGNGRPFVLELINPVVSQVPNHILIEVQEEVSRVSDQKVLVKSFQVSNKKDIQKNMKIGETTKSYYAKCCSQHAVSFEELEEINSKFKPFKIEQQTPIRVLHRRSLCTRTRMIHELKLTLDPTDDHLFNLEITTESGTYIKEFVHSDFGRTSPSLKDFMATGILDILTLDVQEVKHDWPPIQTN